jgi:hypothetical protein
VWRFVVPSKKPTPRPEVPSLEDLADPERARALYHKGPTCSIQKALEMIPAEQGELLRKALDNPNARGIDIADALAAFDLDVNPHTVQRHRRGRCRCDR